MVDPEEAQKSACYRERALSLPVNRRRDYESLCYIHVSGAEFNLAKSFGYFLSVAAFGFGLGLTAAYALDGTRRPANIADLPILAPSGADEPYYAYSSKVREWFRMRQLGDFEAARKFLEDAARDGDVGAIWKLGRMYGDGDSVKQSDQRAFEYFRTLADSHADEAPGGSPPPPAARAVPKNETARDGRQERSQAFGQHRFRGNSAAMSRFTPTDRQASALLF